MIENFTIFFSLLDTWPGWILNIVGSNSASHSHLLDIFIVWGVVQNSISIADYSAIFNYFPISSNICNHSKISAWKEPAIPDGSEHFWPVSGLKKVISLGEKNTLFNRVFWDIKLEWQKSHQKAQLKMKINKFIFDLTEKNSISWFKWLNV